MTLKEIIKQHPEWADLDVVLYTGDNAEYQYVGAQAGVYTDTDLDESPRRKVLVFSAN